MSETKTTVSDSNPSCSKLSWQAKIGKVRYINIFLFHLLGYECDSIPESAVLRGIPYSEDTYEERFRQSAFQHLQSKGRDEAVLFLENDGFTCVRYSCQLSTTYRDSAYDVVFGTNPQNRSSVLGDRYNFKNTYTISVLSNKIERPQSISVEFERIETNE